MTRDEEVTPDEAVGGVVDTPRQEGPLTPPRISCTSNRIGEESLRFSCEARIRAVTLVVRCTAPRRPEHAPEECGLRGKRGGPAVTDKPDQPARRPEPPTDRPDPTNVSPKEDPAVNDQLDVAVHDSEVLAEIEMMTNLIIATSESDGPLPQMQIDEILGVAEDTPPV